MSTHVLLLNEHLFVYIPTSQMAHAAIATFQWRPISSSGTSGRRLLDDRSGPSLLFGISALIGGRTRSLKVKVPYTNNAKPATCSHLKLSHPSPSETIQINRVLHVSMIEREVAEMLLVTLRPKKLKPPIETMIRRLVTAIVLLLKTSRYPSCASK